MSYTPYLISNFATGLEKRLQAWLSLDDAQKELYDGFVYRGTMSKREGYKYYANGESLFRKWNVNSALSADFSYKLKNTTLYVGPQIRYQHLPTYVDKYPIKEYRVDYGIRVGVIKSLR